MNKNLSELICSGNYTLFVCERKSNKSMVFCWTQSENSEKPCSSVTVYHVEHPVYVSEWQECHQKASEQISSHQVNLLRPADYDDYESHLIINIKDNYKNKHSL